MKLSEGTRLPDASLLVMRDDGPEPVSLGDLLRGRKVVIFAVPGAFTRTCHSAHLPSFIRTKSAFDARGIDDIICISVNDPFVMQEWGRVTGATEAGILMLADPECAFTRSVEMDFSAPPAGLIGRSKRYAMIVDDGVVTVLRVEESRGTCEMSGGEALLDHVA